MKLLFYIFLSLSASYCMAQGDNVITIRKESKPTTSIEYSEIFTYLDTMTYHKSKLNKVLYGFGNDYCLFNKDEVVIFEKKISFRLKKLILSSPKKFWKTVKKKKLVYKKHSLSSTLLYINETVYYQKFQYKYAIDSQTKDTLQVSKIKLGKLRTKGGRSYAKHVVKIENDSISFNNYFLPNNILHSTDAELELIVDTFIKNKNPLLTSRNISCIKFQNQTATNINSSYNRNKDNKTIVYSKSFQLNSIWNQLSFIL